MKLQLNPSDTELINELRKRPEMTINDLVRTLGVTANAVRQRLVRLMASGLICRETSIEGRGRPSHTYHLSEDGTRCCGDNFPDLAKALWEEIQTLDNASLRQRVMEGAAKRLAESYDLEIEGETVEERLASVQKFFGDRDIPISVDSVNSLPIVKVHACPYPDLRDDEHHFCNVEKQMFSKVLGAPVELCECRKDGDTCCTFQVIQEKP